MARQKLLRSQSASTFALQLQYAQRIAATTHCDSGLIDLQNLARSA
jgi:hypothetical protein